ncbi:MAG: GNAT family N-acetyltransferase [Kiritimatiellae bacterium]|nr:GNAT family N-acetyltransferase [Kiritimatiellia bacterium]MDD4737392.1 GNAT family N-acetyltransferase [Kiritimatiellia bacterium]
MAFDLSRHEPAHPALKAYVEGRAALALGVQQRLSEDVSSSSSRGSVLRILPDLLWSDSWAEEDGMPHALFPSPTRFRRYVIGPPVAGGGGVERCGEYSRLQTTTNWALDLRLFRDLDEYFSHLSKSMKKKLKRYVNGADRWGLKMERIQTRAHLDRFLKVFSLQFPGANWATTDRSFFYEAYTLFEELGCAKGYLMLDERGVDAVAVLGYYTGRAYNLHLLARQDSSLDFLSPGYCATYALIKEVMEEKRADYFFFGPGHFEYKERFLGSALPIYRYERHSLMNLPGLIRLHHRACRGGVRR